MFVSTAVFYSVQKSLQVLFVTFTKFHAFTVLSCCIYVSLGMHPIRFTVVVMSMLYAFSIHSIHLKDKKIDTVLILLDAQYEERNTHGFDTSTLILESKYKKRRIPITFQSNRYLPHASCTRRSSFQFLRF